MTMLTRALLFMAVCVGIACGHSDEAWQAQLARYDQLNGRYVETEKSYQEERGAREKTQADLDRTRQRASQLEESLKQSSMENQKLTASLDEVKGRCASPVSGNCRNIDGNIGVGDEWGSSWIDLSAPATFEAGTRLRVTLVDNRAKRVLIRLLPLGQNPGQPVGVLGTFDVPSNRIVEVTVPDRRKSITQISVHGSPKAWHWRLGADNGPAIVQAIARCP